MKFTYNIWKTSENLLSTGFLINKWKPIFLSCWKRHDMKEIWFFLKSTDSDVLKQSKFIHFETKVIKNLS